MLGKKYSLGSIVEETGEARIKLANFDELKAQSDDVASFLNTFSPDSGFVYLHVIAMGAGEYYGCNINGDYFPERDLIARHNTFVTNAKVFKEHDNKPYSPDYGHVAFSWYNPKMHRVELILAVDKIKGKEFIDRQARGEQLEVSMGCFPAGTKVLLADLSHKNIEDVNPGDIVVSHLNNHRVVVTKMMYQYTGDYYNVEVDYACKFKATGNHPIFVEKENGYTCINTRDLMIGDSVIRFTDTGERVNGTVTNICNLGDVTDLTVYNLSVEHDESYVVENIAVHNCKVAFDVCSICGNKAKKASDYCTHIRHDKKKIYPDGKQPYMINYNPTFFDISIVRRRADRIAYVLSKVASADNSVSNYMADEFENLGNSIPFAPHPEEAVFDWDEPSVEKSATIDDPKSLTLQEKIAMIKHINSAAVKVMDKGVQKLIPALEREEPDLPVELLDRIARKYSIPDILRSFALRATPMKPREFARIVIVQTGIPKENFSEVLQGILSATPVKRLPDAHYQGEIGKLLDPFLMDRSSFLPAVIHRILKLKAQPEKTAAAITLDPIGSYLDLDSRLAFGHVRRPLSYQAIGPEIPENAIAVQKDPYATTPVIMNAAMLEQERRRPKLKDPVLSPGKTAMALGALYAAYRNVDAVKALANDPKALAILTAAAALIHSKARMAAPATMQQKVAGIMSAAGKIAVPFVGSHFLAAHYRNQYNNGINLNPVEQYIAENPDVLSVAGPIALHYGLKKHAAINDVAIPDVTDLLGVEKIAELSDTAADAARNIFSGIILRGKSRSILSSTLDNAIDTHVMNTLLGSNSQQ